MDNTSVLIFNAITGFISDLNTEFGNRFKSIALYNRLLEKTGIVHIGPINKHIECFRTFFLTNQKALIEQDVNLLSVTKISYSNNVYVDVANVMKATNKENGQIIWKHLLTIWGLIDPTSQAKKVLHESLKNGDDKEAEFLSGILEKVQKTAEDANISESSNPMDALSGLMKSGAMNDLVSGMYKGLSDGSLDVGKLMSNVQNMVGAIGAGGCDNNGGNGTGNGTGNGGGMPDFSQMMGMMGPMMANLMGGANGGGGGMPDISQMMGMMSNMSQNIPKLEEKKDKE